MPAQALYLKWRPRSFDHVIGQDQITRTLRNALIQDRIRHAYLFNGPRGTGKTTMARILAKAVNCLHPHPAERPCDICNHCEAINEGRFLDLIEIDAASHNGVDDVRDLRDRVAFAPSEGGYKVYIIDEVHRFSGAAFDALLKTLEEPPPHTLFVLATTELDKVPATIRSRSLVFEFRRVSLREVADRLEMIANYENIQIDRAVLELIAQQGTGSVRDSISLLDQLIVDPEQRITLEIAERVIGTAGNRSVGKLVQAVIDNDGATALDVLNQAIDDGADPNQFGRQIVEYLRNLMLTQTGGPALIDVSDEMQATLQQQTRLIGRSALIRAVRVFNAALGELRSGWQPQLPLELAIIESTRPLHEEAPPPPMHAQTVVPTPAATPAASPSADKAEAVPTPEVSGPGDVVAVTLADLRNAWPAVLRLMRETNNKHIPIAAQFEKASIRSFDRKTLTLSVESQTLQSMLEDKEKQGVLTTAIQRHFKQRFKLQLKIMVAEASSGGLNDTAVDDPLVNHLSNAYSGKVSSADDVQPD